MPEWTKDQQRTIDSRDKNILVSAAAGSGKTAVLVERIKKLIIEEHVDVDRFLITTFTKAASEEMRQRLEKAVRQELGKTGQDGASGTGSDRAFLLRQLQILPSAAIGTFHSFAIDIIRQYFYLTDLEPGFTILDEVQQSIMKRDAVDQVFARRYEESSPEFFAFLERHSSDRNDNALKDNLIKMYNSLRSIPFYMEWAKKKTELMKSQSPSKDMGLLEYIAAETATSLAKAGEYYDKAAELLNTPYSQDIFSKAAEDAANINNAVSRAADYDFMQSFFNTSLNSMRAKKAEQQAFDAVKEEVKELRAQGKKILDKIKDRYYLRSIDDYNAEINAVYEDTKYLVDMIEEFEIIYKSAKAEENAIDMDDVMHYAIDVLEDERAAAEQRQRFRYIFVDEYQDSNMLQETIVRKIARANNLFMVGDVKQSIYKFRLAEPEIFMDKAKEYKHDDNPESMVIDLNSNFRSKENVTKAVNGVFENVMPGYDEDAALHCMAPEGDPGHLTGIHIIDMESVQTEDLESSELEASVVAEIIRDAVGQEFFDVKDKCTKTITYRDIAVLARAGNTVAEIERYLNNEGIPAYGDTGEGYFETVEIQVFMNLLKVIDNMRQDVPLISVMRSAIFGFSVRELAKIRINKKDGSFCTAVREYMASGPDRDLRQKLQNMDDSISMWKEMGKTVPLEELVRVLLYDTGFYDYCSGLPVGRQRVSNLQLIVEKAAVFERTNHSGLNGFLRYVQAMAESKTSEAEAKTIGEGEDVVRVMTVHKSKGLEFPVVIFTGAGRQITGGGGKSSAPIHKDFGIGLKLINRQEHWQKKTLLQNVIAAKQSGENLDEAVRILYVAMTRAKDRLEIVGSVKKQDDLKDVTGLGSYLEMIYPSLKDSDSVDIKIYNRVEESEEGGWHKNKVSDLIAMAQQEGIAEGRLAEEIDRRLSFAYEKTETPIKLKYSVTELNREEAGEGHDSYAVPIASFEPEMTKHKLTAAEVGTIMHLIMEKIDFTKAKALGTEYIDSVADRLVESGKLTPEERAVVQSDKIAAFFDQEIGARAAKAFAEGKLYREKEFILEREIQGQKAVVQGIIDCWFEDERGPVLIDYKNSFMGRGRSIEDIIETYKGQIEIYRDALEGALGKNVEEAYLFLFDIGTFVQIIFQ